MSIHLYIIYICFYATISELSSCDWGHVAYKVGDIYYLAI